MDPIVLLHGFAGSSRSWEGIAAGWAPELHTLRPPGFDRVVGHVLQGAPPRFALAGYSMGARLALRVALADPGRVARLVLVAGTAGIDDPAERAARAQADDRLAERLRAATPVEAAELWGAQPVWAGDPPEVRAAQAAEVRAHDPAVLADALSALSTGRMDPMWQHLPRLTMPAVVLAGERDARYVSLGRRLVAALPDAELRVVPGAGHGLLREAPGAVAEAIAGA